MRIEQIKIKNFKVFKDVTVSNLPPMCVFLGVNGSGKTTLFDVFSFLSEALRDNVTVAVNRRGGFRELISRGCNVETDSIEIEIIFRLDSDTMIDYNVEISLVNNRIVVKKEQGEIHHSNEPFKLFLSFSGGTGNVNNNDSNVHFDLESPDILAVKILSSLRGYAWSRGVFNKFSSAYIINFDNDTLRTPSNRMEKTFLFSDGSNLAHITKDLYENKRYIFDKILAKLPKHIPAINHVEALKTEDGRIVLKFQDKHFKDPFETQNVSDGTMKFFAYLVLLSGYYPGRLLCLEEPEKDFHPQIIPYLVEEIRQNAEQRSEQVFVSTHSPEFVDSVQLDELFYMVKQDGFSTIRAAADDPVVRELAKNNSLGWLWRNNYLQANSL